jgi:hypothetical protein
VATVRVLAEYVTLKVEDPAAGSRIIGYLKDSIVGNVEAESLKHHLDLGMVEEVEAPKQEPPADDGPKSPAKSASKADWVAYVVEHRGVSQEDADASTRDELAATYGD